MLAKMLATAIRNYLNSSSLCLVNCNLFGKRSGVQSRAFRFSEVVIVGCVDHRKQIPEPHRRLHASNRLNMRIIANHPKVQADQQTTVIVK